MNLPAIIERHPRWSALAAGIISALGFAPLGWWPLTLAALALLIALVARTPRIATAFNFGWLFGLGHFAMSNNWIATAFTYQAAMPAWLGWVAVLLLSLYLALFPALATAMARWLQLRLRAADQAPILPLLLAASWILTEWLRSWLFTGFAWNPLAAIAPFAAAPARLIGTYGQSGLIVLVAGSLWLLASRQWRAAALSAGLPIAAIMALSITQTAPLANAPRPAVTIVQPNIEQGDKWDLAQRRSNFAKLARLSPRRGTRPRLLLWPEAAVPDFLEDGYPLDWYLEPPGDTRRRLGSLLAPGDLLLTGAVKLEPNAARNDVLGARNAMFVIDPAGRLGARYDKAHLVPFGEYLPLRPLLSRLGLSRLAPGSVDFWPGPGARTVDLGRFGRAGIQICYEIIFSGQVVDRAHRPDFLFNPSNDAWFGAWGPPQHLAQARLRAIEEGLPVVRATPTGISAIIAADGRVLHAIPLRQAGRIDADLPAATAPTPFARFGNLAPLALAALFMLVAVAMPRLRR